jgi:hypothetical protein
VHSAPPLLESAALGQAKPARHARQAP